MCPHSFDNQTWTIHCSHAIAGHFPCVPHWNLQASVKLNIYSPTLSFPKTLEELLKKSEQEIRQLMLSLKVCLRKTAYASLSTPTYTMPTSQAEQPPQLLNSSLFV